MTREDMLALADAHERQGITFARLSVRDDFDPLHGRDVSCVYVGAAADCLAIAAALRARAEVM
jgi:hypothetical protein